MNPALSGPPLEIDAWMDRFCSQLQAAFQQRLIFVGLQGSRGRGEAGSDSDIDVVVILDRLEGPELERYRLLLDRLPHRELVCGFVSGRGELAAWDRAELFQFARDTRPWLGQLSDILPPLEEGDVRRAVHSCACGIYHACCHNLLHDHSAQLLRSLYKSAFFTLQAKCYLEGGTYFRTRASLLPQLNGADRAVLAGEERAAALEDCGDGTFQQLSLELLSWASRLVRQYGC